MTYDALLARFDAIRKTRPTDRRSVQLLANVRYALLGSNFTDFAGAREGLDLLETHLAG